ncbi:upstream activation factor subunit spp27 isoform X5 [Vigna angularis]|uniref:upstream activation factor subunit spp27 isoform X5 n=1 Tax=Phaseolus angularis TaxID=3914 RepID=UPI0022B3D859|nr:upstream activation factor subunit spp27 isoform X5 [Vigna angularis]
MVSESELIGRLREFLRSSDLNTTTTATVRRQLEADFGIDLSHRKAFIREQVDLFLQTEHNQPQQQQQDDDVPKDEGEEEEEALNNPDQSESSDSKEESEEDDDNDEEERDKPKHAKNAQKNKGRSNKLGDEVAKKRGGGFCKLCSLSPQLQEFMGAPEMARTEVVKQIWAYIRERNLQDPNNRRNIICDDRMRALFNVNSINMFQMNKVLSKHIWPLDSDDDSDEPKRKEKRQKGAGKSGFLAPLQLSDALVNFLGTGESELSRTDVIKRMWDYIKGNNLQDPSNKRQIICDEKLKELFDVDSFNGFTVTKLLAPHFIKTQQ